MGRGAVWRRIVPPRARVTLDDVHRSDGGAVRASGADVSAVSLCRSDRGQGGAQKGKRKGSRRVALPINYEFGVKKNRRPCQSGRRFFDDLPSEAALSMLGAVGLGRLDILTVYRPRL